MVWWMHWRSHFPPVGSCCDSGLDAERWGLRQEPPGSVDAWPAELGMFLQQLLSPRKEPGNIWIVGLCLWFA